MHITSPSPSSCASQQSLPAGQHGALDTPAHLFYADSAGMTRMPTPRHGSEYQQGRIAGVVRTRRIWANQEESSAIMRRRAGNPPASTATLAARAQNTAMQWGRGALGLACQLGQGLGRTAGQMQSLASRVLQCSGDVGGQVVRAGLETAARGAQGLDRTLDHVLHAFSPWTRANCQVPAGDADNPRKDKPVEPAITRDRLNSLLAGAWIETVAELKATAYVSSCIEVTCHQVDDDQLLNGINATFFVEHDVECKSEKFITYYLPMFSVMLTDAEVDVLQQAQCLRADITYGAERIGNLTHEEWQATGTAAVVVAVPQELKDYLLTRGTDDFAHCVLRSLGENMVCSIASEASPTDFPNSSPTPAKGNVSFVPAPNASSTPSVPTPGGAAPALVATLSVAGALAGTALVFVLIRKACRDQEGMNSVTTAVPLEETGDGEE